MKRVVQARDDLVKAACTGNVRLLLSAIRRGANTNARYRGRTILLWAIQEGHMNVAITLIRAGASLEKRDDHGFTPLDQAVGEGNLELVKLLLKAGAKVNGRTRNGSPLHTACAYRRVQIAKLLLTNGASTTTLNADGHTPESLTKIRSNQSDRRLQKILKLASLGRNNAQP